MFRTSLLLIFIVVSLAADAAAQSTCEPNWSAVPPGVLVSVEVVEFESGEPLPSFRALPGTASGGRDGIARWQSHLIRETTDGYYHWPIARSYDKFQLRFEADGYQPFVTAWIRKSDPPQSLTVRLARDPGLEIHVVDPDGNKAVGAVAAIAFPNRSIQLKAGKIHVANRDPQSLRERWDNPIIGTTDDEGRIRLPPETSFAFLYVVHDTGIAELPHDDLDDGQQIQLEAWGAIDGQTWWIDRAGADENLRLSVSHNFGPTGNIELLSMFTGFHSDAQGRFRLKRIPPGMVQLSRAFKSVDGHGGYLFPGMHFRIAPGKTTPVVLGGRGRTVIGKLTGLASWQNISLRFAPHDYSWKFGGNRNELVKNSDLGPVYFRDGPTVNDDGTFRIENVLPESYVLFISNTDRSIYHAHRMRIPQPTEDNPTEPYDGGEVNVRRR